MGKGKRYRKKHGIYTKFDHSECWDLDDTIAKFVLPRLIVFKKENNGTPIDKDYHGSDVRYLSSEKWDEILDTMIWSFNEIASDRIYDCPGCIDSETGRLSHEKLKLYMDQVQLGIDNFAKYFMNLWW